MILQSKARSLGCSLNLYSLPGVHLTQWCPSTQNTSWFRESQNTTDPTPPMPGWYIYIADDALRLQPMGSRSHDCSSSAGLLDSYPAVLLYLAGDALHQQPMGSKSHDCSSYVGCGGIPCSTLVSPNASLHKWQQVVAPR